MRVLIGLLLQNPELAQLVPDLSPLRTLNEPGLDLLKTDRTLSRKSGHYYRSNT